MKDYVCRAIAYNKFVRIYAASSTELVETARKIHGLWPTSCAALGRTLTAAAIISTNYKSDEHLTFRFETDGPIDLMVVEANSGKVRGYLSNPEVFMQYSNGHLAVGKAMMTTGGYMHVVKDLNLKQPFGTTVALQTGEIGDDFAYYFHSSEQTPSSVGLGVLVNPDNSCSAAGGFILQLMPGCPDETITEIETRLASIKPVSEMIAEGYTPELIIRELAGDDFEIIGRDDISYSCPCSRERFFRGIMSLGKNEIEDIINTDGKAEVACNFCRKNYVFEKSDLEKMLKQIAEKKR